MAEQHTVIIRAESFGIGFDITVEPAPTWANFNTERPTIKGARRYAGALGTVHRWKIDDQSGEPA